MPSCGRRVRACRTWIAWVSTARPGASTRGARSWAPSWTPRAENMPPYGNQVRRTTMTTTDLQGVKRTEGQRGESAGHDAGATPRVAGERHRVASKVATE